MASPTGLEEIVDEYHHLLEEHRRTAPESSSRRHMLDRLERLEGRFESMLLREVPDEAAREAWRDRLHHGLPAPSTPAASRPLVFEGRSDAGSTVEIRLLPDGDLDVAVDGTPVERLSDALDTDVYTVGSQAFSETFDAPPDAMEAFRDWVSDPSGPPPWEHARTLLEAGLVDRHFGVTARGRRAMRAGSGPRT